MVLPHTKARRSSSGSYERPRPLYGLQRESGVGEPLGVQLEASAAWAKWSELPLAA